MRLYRTVDGQQQNKKYIYVEKDTGNIWIIYRNINKINDPSETPQTGFLRKPRERDILENLEKEISMKTNHGGGTMCRGI